MREIVVLPCECHGVCRLGFLYSRIVQFAEKGRQGIQTTRQAKWRRLNATLTKSGYLQTAIHGKTTRLNRLIAIVFLGNPCGYPEVHHINGVRTDNRVENLRWGTQKMNAADRDIHGTTARGSRNAVAKLNEVSVAQIKQLVLEKPLQSIADQFGVSKKLILLIKQNKIWKHVS